MPMSVFLYLLKIYWRNRILYHLNKIKSLISSVLLLVLFFSCEVYAAELSGKITDQITGNPLPGVSVWLEGTNYSTITDANGDYLIKNLPDGFYTVIIDAPNYKQKVYRDLGVGIYDQVDDAPVGEVPRVFNVEQNFPNPFNPETAIIYFLPKSAQVSFRIYDALGRTVYEIPESWQSDGSHTIHWKGVNTENNTLPSGIYFYTVQTREWQETKKMLLIQ